MIYLLKKLRLFGMYRKICMFFINRIFVGTSMISCSAKRRLLRAQGYKIGNGTTIVGPIFIMGQLNIGENCWINRGFTVHGNGSVKIGDNCDIAPEVEFLTGGHQIGDSNRRAGKGEIYKITVGNGCWIGARATVMKNINLGDGSVVAACACITKDVPDNTLVGGVPAKKIKDLENL